MGPLLSPRAQGPFLHAVAIWHEAQSAVLNLRSAPLQLGPRLKVIAIIDPAKATAEMVLARKRASFVVSAYADTRICATFEDFIETMTAAETPNAFIIGSPPAYRGSTAPRRDIEMQILKAFPNKTPAVRFPAWLAPARSHADAEPVPANRCSSRSPSVPTLSRTP